MTLIDELVPHWGLGHELPEEVGYAYRKPHASEPNHGINDVRVIESRLNNTPESCLIFHRMTWKD